MPSYKRLLVASSKGGVGKSTTALGLALSFAESDKKVLLCDLDLTSRSLDSLTGADKVSVYDIGDVISGKAPSSVTCRPWGKYPNISLITACSLSKIGELAEESGTEPSRLIKNALIRIKDECEYDIIIADTGGGIEYASAVADLFEMALVTSEQSATSVRAAEFASYALRQSGVGTARLVICSFDLGAVKKEKRAGIIEMIDSSSLACVGVVPLDKKIARYQDKGLPPEDSVAQSAYKNIARRLLGYDVPLFYGMKAYYKKRKSAF